MLATRTQLVPTLSGIAAALALLGAAIVLVKIKPGGAGGAGGAAQGTAPDA